MRFRWDILWSVIFWITLVGCVINMILVSDTLTRWKWGYFTIDWIPPMLIMIILYFINQNLRMGDLERKLNRFVSQEQGVK